MYSEPYRGYVDDACIRKMWKTYTGTISWIRICLKVSTLCFWDFERHTIYKFETNFEWQGH